MTEQQPDTGAAWLQLPDPDTARRWEEVSPGSVERILKIVESQTIRKADAAIEAEKSERKLAWVSLFIGATLALTLIVAAILFFALGNNVAGGLLLGVPATGVAISFIPKAIAGRKGTHVGS